MNLEIMKLTEEKVGNILKHTDTGDYFLNRTLIVQTLKSTINKWDFMKLKSFCKAKISIGQQHTEWEKIFTNLISVKGLISREYKELKKLDNNNKNNLIKI